MLGSPGVTRPQHALDSILELNNSQRRYYIEYTQVADGFRPDAGFLQRFGGYRAVSAQWNEHWRWKSLRNAGFLTRDSRMKERKKYGQRGARRRFQFSKR